MSRLSPDIIISLLLMTLSAVFFVETFGMQKVHLAIIGAKLWPRLVVIVLFFLSTLYFIQSIRATRPPPGAPLTLKGWIIDNRNVIGCFATYALFLLTLPYLGMLLGGSLFVFATLTLIGRRDLRSHLIHAVVAVVTIGGMWAMFRFGLGVILPEGEILPR
ncbi:MAG: tripartite tricarboxylate transporter TctB family protein [Gammaproteobacteria bacterium]|nr:tripartite tricarboxylate transporter TctB family protein [Gammaproteobacteria bacterium]MDH3411387.1 tripartite tricarboxylate transporter TctB family protein [Gammaproteobacteria bacterium]